MWLLLLVDVYRVVNRGLYVYKLHYSSLGDHTKTWPNTQAQTDRDKQTLFYTHPNHHGGSKQCERPEPWNFDLISLIESQLQIPTCRYRTLHPRP